MNDDMSMDDLVVELRSGNVTYGMVRDYISQECKGGVQSEPTHIIYVFNTLGDVRHAMKDQSQVDRFMRELPNMVAVRKWYNRLNVVRWCDDGRDDAKTRYNKLHIFYKLVDYTVIFALGAFVGMKIAKPKSS